MLPNWIFSLLIALVMGIISYQMINRALPEDLPLSAFILVIGMIKLLETIIHVFQEISSLNKLASFLLSLLLYALPLIFLFGIKSDATRLIGKDVFDFKLNQAMGFIAIVVGFWISYNHLTRGKSSFISTPLLNGSINWNIPTYHLETIGTLLWYAFKYLEMDTFLQGIGFYGIPLLFKAGWLWNASQWTTYLSASSLVWYLYR